MTIAEIKDALPEYAKDLKLNLGSLFNNPGMTDQQVYGTALACAYASRNGVLLRAIAAEAEGKLTDDAITAAKGAAAIMGMNNIYYRFVHLVSEKEYGTMPARLRMNIIGKPGIDKADFELFSLAVSAINGCGMCIDSHEKILKQAGLNKEVVQNAVRIASVLHAVAAVLDAEAALSA
ncbi:carboxymuconolactone decarboxylase family protein [Thalassospira sp.]|uniref:carboxymuconolactone decarboxylase family protein n=1 Tax=Thalassospira sp. TaxID=1912094 RepID=UPI0027325862|nr:carboxymuconolactone decarboxylase family protein [Thalassospira sp.]MDP2697183.1 carboxymuconolactone decarboxylase family protein [Thalassospira sp.]